MTMSTLIAGAGGCKNFKLFPCFKVSTHIFIHDLNREEISQFCRFYGLRYS